jgi:hypothetical protein
MEPTIRLPNDQRAQNDAAQHKEPFAWSDFFPLFLSSTFENWQSKIFNSSGKRRGLAVFYFWVALSLGRATTDLKPKSSACCPNTGSTQPSSTIARKQESRLRPKQPNQRSAPDRAALPPGGHAYPRRPPASSGHHACASIMRRTSHSAARKWAKRAVFGISRILISCNLRTR